MLALQRMNVHLRRTCIHVVSLFRAICPATLTASITTLFRTIRQHLRYSHTEAWQANLNKPQPQLTLSSTLYPIAPEALSE